MADIFAETIEKAEQLAHKLGYDSVEAALQAIEAGEAQNI